MQFLPPPNPSKHLANKDAIVRNDSNVIDTGPEPRYSGHFVT